MSEQRAGERLAREVGPLSLVALFSFFAAARCRRCRRQPPPLKTHRETIKNPPLKKQPPRRRPLFGGLLPAPHDPRRPLLSQRGQGEVRRGQKGLRHVSGDHEGVQGAEVRESFFLFFFREGRGRG